MTGNDDAPPPQPPSKPIPVTALIHNEIVDALQLLDYAVATGYKSAELPLPEDVVVTIKQVATKAGVIGKPPITGDRAKEEPQPITADDWTQFELAYYKLANYMRPVTAESLRNTEIAGKGFFLDVGPSQRFTQFLWIITISYAVFIVLAEWGMNRFGPVQEGSVDSANTLMQLAQLLIPYAYGGLGACAFLLRSAHIHIYERSFDLRRKPEYLNRIVLGTISGGAIILFVDYVQGDDGEVIRLSSAALGFLGGYSTDFLFNTIERVVGALLPKIGVQSVRRAAPAAKSSLDITTGGLTLKDLVERFEKAETPEEKALYKSLIDKLRDRM